MNETLHKAITTLRKPGVIATPTETVWGLSCSALSEAQIERIAKIKNRNPNKSFIVLVNSEEMASKYIGALNKVQKAHLNNNRPTTVVFPKIIGLPKILLAADKSLAFRITQHPELKSLITQLGHPIVSTSANLNGEPAAKTAKELHPSILEAVDYTLNLNSNFKPTAIPSKIVKIDGESVEIIRA